MSNYRIYHFSNIEINKPIILPEQDSLHVIKVLRLVQNNYVNIFNENGEWISKIIDNNKNKAKVLPIEKIKDSESIHKWVHLFFSPLKSTANTFLIAKATELGVNEITQVITERTNNKPLEVDKLVLKSKEAAQQCGRLTLPKINKTVSLTSLLNNLNYKILWLNENQNGKELQQIIPTCGNQISLLIGPEGGFSKNEIDILKCNLITSVYLKGNILKAETAAVISVALSTYL